MASMSVVLRIVGLLLMIFSLSMLPPIGVSLYYHDGALSCFVMCLVVTLVTGLMMWLGFGRSKHELRTRDGFLIVVLFWTVLSIFGTIPFIMDPVKGLDFVNALFESVSGLTTTGASVFRDLNELPRSILYYRQQLHFLGGMGVIVLAVAILPMLGMGGIQLAKVETAGPVKDTRLKPRMTQTAKALWSIYVGLVVLCALAYWAAGMSLFDAIGESYSTISTGGFSMHNSSFAYYNSYTINAIAIIFMILGATNFALHFRVCQRKRPWYYLRDAEFKSYISMVVVATALIAFTLEAIDYFHANYIVIMQSLFSVVSITSTTGFTVNHFSTWPSFIPFFLMFIALIGGSAASTSGGLKVIRVQVLLSQIKREIFRLAHPRAVLPIKVGRKVVPEPVIQAVWAYVAVYIVVFVVLLMALIALGMNLTTAYGALAACLSNTGAGIGAVASNFHDVLPISKYVLIFAMLLGRLEIFTVFVLFSPTYWRP